jgi:peroxiredoxin
MFVLFLVLLDPVQGQVEYHDFGMEINDFSSLGGLQIGQEAPDIIASLSGGEKFNLSEAVKKGDVLLVFYRGFWCPVCNKHLSKMTAEMKALQERGIRVIAISPESHEYIKKTIDQSNLDFPVISDTDGQIMKDYKVFYTVTNEFQERIQSYLKVDIADVNVQDDAALPVPATYLIGHNRLIKFAHYDPNYRNRASVENILSTLDK